MYIWIILVIWKYILLIEDNFFYYKKFIDHQISYTIQEIILRSLKNIVENFSFLFMETRNNDFNSSTLSYPLIVRIIKINKN
jgi:hypothetical protein